MEPAAPSLKDVKWSSASFPLDLLVSSYRLPQLVRLENGENIEGLRENDYLLIHSCRQWTTITAHSLEEGHYVIGPKIEIPVHYGGQFKLLEQDRDIKEPVQYFNSVEEVAKAFPERVYVMEEITFNVKVASGECNEDTEVYNITLCTGDELTLMGQAEILYAKTSKEKSRLNTIFKKIGKLNSISKLGKGKMPCLICMNHRTNESISLPFQCKGRFSTRSPLEIQMQDGEHTIRNIVEKTRLPVNVTVPSPPPRNPYDLHFIREGHRYKFVNIQTKTVVVCCVLRAGKIIPMHFPLHLSVPTFSLPENIAKGEMWQESVVQHWYNICQEQFDIEEYSRAVRDVKADWNEECKSPKKSYCSGHSHIPNSLSYARDELTQSFHRLSVCVYGNNLHGNSEVNLHGCRDLCGDWAVFPQDSSQYQDSGDSGSDYLFPETGEESVKEECRLLNAPPVPPRSSKPSSPTPSVPPPTGKIARQQTRSPSPTLSYYSSGLHSIGLAENEVAGSSDNAQVSCYPCNWIKNESSDLESNLSCGVAASEILPSRLSWPNRYCGGAEGMNTNDLLVDQCRSYYSYPRQKTPATPKRNFPAPFDFSGVDPLTGFTQGTPAEFTDITAGCPKSASYSLETSSEKIVPDNSTKQSMSCPALPPRAPKSSEVNPVLEPLSLSMKIDGAEEGSQTCSPDITEEHFLAKKGMQDIFSISYPFSSPLHMQLAPRSCGDGSPWQPPSDLSGLSIEEVSKSLRFIGLSEDVISFFVSEKIDGNLLVQLTDEILSEDFKLSKLQVKKIMQFINGWRPKM
ncbi:GRB2-associated and regulator of MAPK protein 1 isoform X2 [Dendropsophus ebraccatus]|uniref:GRB2-associated and regulator of MAPK protein 1 isoform X2 n=1 Tax=Dendropsophus ebraccatus TaxID=150705 RepID=UPI003831610B